MISSAYAWSLFALGLQYGANIVLLPVLSHFLTGSEIGLWYAVQLAYTLSLLLEFGYQTSFARSISYVKAGQQKLTATGFSEPTVVSEMNLELMSSLLKCVEIRYRQIAIFIVCSLLSAGTAYLYYLSGSHDNQQALFTVWVIFVLLTAYSFYSAHALPILTGLGHVAQVQRLTAFQKLGAILGASLALLCGTGLWGAMLGWALGNAVIIPIARRALQGDPVVSSAKTKTHCDTSEVMGAISINANKVGSSSIATFMLLRGTSFIASFFLTLPQFGIYSISLQIFQAIANLARLKFTVDLPKLSHLAASNSLKVFRKTTIDAVMVGWAIYSLALLGFWAIGGILLPMLNKTLPALSILDATLLAIIYFLEVTHGSCAIAITLLNIVPYVFATWISAIAVLIGSFAVGYFTSWGLTGFLVVQLTVQLAYNAWKWPLNLYFLTRTNAP